MQRRRKQVIGIIISLCMVMSVFFNSVAVFADSNMIESATILTVPVLEEGASVEAAKMTFDLPEGCKAESCWYVWDEMADDFVKVEDDTFTATDIYRLEAEFSAEEGYELSEDYFDVLNESGVDGDSLFGFTDENENMKWYYRMPVVSLATAIDRVEVHFPAVKEGNISKIDDVVIYAGEEVIDIENVQITATWDRDNGEEWGDANGLVIEEGYCYYLYFEMTPNEGYYFDEEVDVYFNGEVDRYAYSSPKNIGSYLEYNLMSPIESIELAGLPEEKAGEMMADELEALENLDALGVEIFVTWFDEEGDEVTGLAMESGKKYTAQIEVNAYGMFQLSEDFVLLIDGEEYSPTKVYSPYQLLVKIKYDLTAASEEGTTESEEATTTPGEDTTAPEEDTTTSKEETTETPTTENKPGADTGNKTDAPKTGDSSMMFVWAAVFVLSAGAMIMVRKKSI